MSHDNTEENSRLLRRETLVPALLVVLALGVLVFSLSSLSAPANAQTTEQAPVWETRTTGTTQMNDVEIALTPQTYENGQLFIDLAANTHSVALSEHDLMRQATLTVDGQTYQPVSAPRMSGHHVSGQLVFALDKQPGAFSVTISGVPSVQERTFTWGAP